MCKKIKLLAFLTLLVAGISNAQTENSPYSRYGLGDQLPSYNIMARGIGGVSAAYADVISVNFLNPASYSRLKRSTFDFGLELDSRTLRTINPPRKFSSTSPIISYIQLGIPLSKTRNWGMNIGLRPVTRINYKLERLELKNGVDDSLSSLFEGSGGTYEVYTGTGFTIGKLSLGFNVGYLFGSKNFSTKRFVINDTAFNYPSQHSSSTSYGGLFGNAGLQYTIQLNKKNMVRVGAYGSLKQKFNASKDERVFTFEQQSSGELDTIDVVAHNDISGKVTYPASYGAGIMFYAGDRWLVGADYGETKWNDYRFFGQKDSVQDSWKFHVGGQIIPNITSAKSYWGRVTYRAGFSFGKDYVFVANDDLPTWGVSLGLGLPMRQPTYTYQASIINTSFEFGQRGNNGNLIRENYFRFSVGLTLSDIWFIKRKYD